MLSIAPIALVPSSLPYYVDEVANHHISRVWRSIHPDDRLFYGRLVVLLSARFTSSRTTARHSSDLWPHLPLSIIAAAMSATTFIVSTMDRPSLN